MFFVMVWGEASRAGSIARLSGSSGRGAILRVVCGRARGRWSVTDSTLLGDEENL